MKTRLILTALTRSSLLLLAFLLLPTMAWAQVILDPGEFKGEFEDDFAFETLIVVERAIQFVRCPGTLIDFSCRANLGDGRDGTAAVEFTDEHIKTMKLKAAATNVFTSNRKEAVARGRISTAFCIRGEVSDCGGNAAEQTITANVSYHVSWAGRVVTFGPGATVAFAISVRIRDMLTSKIVAVETLENFSAGSLRGATKTIAKVPVPVPEIQDAGQSAIRKFVVQLQRGRPYAFELFGAAIARTRVNLICPPNCGTATNNFLDSIVFSGPDQNGIRLREFSIDVATDAAVEVAEEIADLKMLIQSLQQLVGDLTDQLDASDENVTRQIDDIGVEIDTLTASLEEEIDGLRADVSSLQQQIQALNGQIAALQQKLDDDDDDDDEEDDDDDDDDDD